MSTITRPPREKICLCTCTSCRTLNSRTAVHYNAGAWVSRSTRDRHMDDDRIRSRHRRPHVLTLPPLQESKVLLCIPSRTKFQFLREEMDWLIDLPILSPYKPLVFQNIPESHGEFKWPSENEIVIFNSGLHSLDAKRLINDTLLHVEQRLCSIYAYLRARRGAIEIQDLEAMALEGLYKITTVKKAEWDQQRLSNLTPKSVVNTELFFLRQGPQNTTVRAACLTSLILENQYFVSRRALRTHLGGIRDILRQSGTSADCLSALPKDPRIISSYFNLDPVTRKYLSCPQCYKLYPYSPENAKHPSPTTCLNKETQDSAICGEALWREHRTFDDEIRHAPISIQEHQELKTWLGRFLSRAGMEDLIDGRPYGSAPEVVDDIWLSSVFRDLKGPDGKAFYPGPPGEGRLVFSLSVDSFNPFGNKTAKQSSSSTGVWMVLLNLPWHLRYLPENIYLVGILAGKPSKEQLNHYIQLIVDELLEFWTKGVAYSRTYKCKLGRIIRAILIPVVCDMLGARQVIGYASATTAHYFCMLCDLDIDDIDNLDRKEWPMKELHHVRFFAKLWKDAKSEDQRKSIFDAFGWRWSPLFDLPYWNPLLYTVIESMHTLDLNLLDNHCRDLFRIDLDNLGGDGSAGPVLPKNLVVQDKTKLLPCLKLVRQNDGTLLYKLLELHRKILYTFCILYDIKREGCQVVLGSRWVLAQSIHTWRQLLEDVRVLDNLPDYEDNSPSHGGVIEKSDDGERAMSDDPPAEDIEMTEAEAELDLDIAESNLEIEEGPEIEAEQEEEIGNITLDELPDKLRITAIRVVKHLTATEDRPKKRARAFAQSTIKIYHAIMNELRIPIPEKSSKTILHNSILSLIDENTAYYERLVELVSSEDDGTHGAVLGQDVMEKVWLDMTRTQFPTWISPAPPNWGTTKRGKLSADNWRVICTIHLPVTLIWMWRHETGRKRELLRNFLDLVSAVRVANMRVSSPSQIAAYESLITRYLEGIKDLFPHERLKPTHHAALHIGDVLRRFGPNHSHTAHYYERYIALFHKMNTNRQIVKLERTLLHESARHANLNALLSDDDGLRGTVEQILKTMKAIQSEDIRGYQLANVLNPSIPEALRTREIKPFTLDSDEFRMYCQLQQSRGRNDIRNDFICLKRVSFRGTSYGTSGSVHFRDSTIIFKTILGGGEAPGIIETIFHYGSDMQCPSTDTTDFYAVVREYRRVQRDQFVDPYVQYGFAAGYLCETEPQDTRIIDFSQIVSHLAITSFPEENLVHIMPLNMMSTHFSPD